MYNIENLNELVEQIKQNGDAINLVVADGGFEIKKNEKGEHMENYQELFSSRIILSEILVMLKALQPGGKPSPLNYALSKFVVNLFRWRRHAGHFVCKAFDCFSSLSASFIYLLTLLFGEVCVVKPLRSRIVNSERYLVGKFMKRHGQSHQTLLRVCEHLHGQCNDNLSPLSLFPLKQMQEDEVLLCNLLSPRTLPHSQVHADIYGVHANDAGDHMRQANESTQNGAG